MYIYKKCVNIKEGRKRNPIPFMGIGFQYIIYIMKNLFKKIKGFGILEVIVAIGIITLSLTGILSLIMQNSRVYYINKSRYIAVMLAQEGVELVRNVRDSNWDRNDPPTTIVDWKNGDSINSNIEGDGSYAIEIDDNGNITITNVSGIDDVSARLKIGTDVNNLGRYFHNDPGTSQDSPYYRIIETSDGGSCLSPDCLKLVSRVKWFERGYNHEHQTEIFLYNWW